MKDVVNTATRASMALVLLILSACVGCPSAPTPYEIEEESVAITNDAGEIRCSGVWIGHDRVLTAAHCMGKAGIGEAGMIRTRDQALHVGYWTAQMDEHLDLAVMTIWHPPAHHRFARVAKRDPRDGDRVYMAGNPLGLGWSYMESVVSANRGIDIDDNKGLVHMLQIQGPICGGQSGSAAFNSNGEIIGIIVREKSSSFSVCGIGLAVHRDIVEAFLKDE